MAGIFVCYRRDDTAGWAGRLCADLRAGLRGATVFMDIDAIPPGVRFDEYIAQAVGSCDVLIALIGPHWLTAADKSGRRRLEDPGDFTRIEIVTALNRNIRVIPALVGGAEVPTAEDLPADLKPLARRQSYELADHRWAADCERLLLALRPIVQTKRPTVRNVLLSVGLAVVLILAGYGVKVWHDQSAEPFVIPGTDHRFLEKNGHLVSAANGGPLCPTPPGWHTDCYALEPQHRQNWRNTPDGYVANGKKVKTFTNRSERIFEILGTKHAFYVDDGHLFYYATATILCPWPKAGVAKCHTIEAQYQDKWRNTPEGFIANGHAFNAIEVMRDVRQGLF